MQAAVSLNFCEPSRELSLEDNKSTLGRKICSSTLYLGKSTLHKVIVPLPGISCLGKAAVTATSTSLHGANSLYFMCEHIKSGPLNPSLSKKIFNKHSVPPSKLLKIAFLTLLSYKYQHSN